MLDHFDKKRESIKMLLDMLKKSAGDEVASHMTDLSKPHAALMQPASDSQMMSKGGMPLTSDEPCEVKESELPEAEGAEHAAPIMGEIEEEDEDNNQSAFMGLMKRKK